MKMDATIAYLRQAAKKAIEAAEHLTSLGPYKLHHALGSVDDARRELDICEHHIKRALEANDLVQLGRFETPEEAYKHLVKVAMEDKKRREV